MDSISIDRAIANTEHLDSKQGTLYNCQHLIKKFEKLLELPEYRTKTSFTCDYEKNKCVILPDYFYCYGMEKAAKEFDNLLWKYDYTRPVSVEPVIKYTSIFNSPEHLQTDFSQQLDAIRKRERHSLQSGAHIRFTIKLKN